MAWWHQSKVVDNISQNLEGYVLLLTACPGGSSLLAGWRQGNMHVPGYFGHHMHNQKKLLSIVVTMLCHYHTVSFKILTIDNPKPAHVGEVWGVCCKFLLPLAYNGKTAYKKNILKSHTVCILLSCASKICNNMMEGSQNAAQLIIMMSSHGSFSMLLVICGQIHW